MTEIWIGVAILVTGTYLLKYLGLAAPQSLLEHDLMVRAGAILPAGLLAALVAVQTFADGSRLIIDARLAGLAAAALLLALRVPFLPMLVGAAATTALVRLWF